MKSFYLILCILLFSENFVLAQGKEELLKRKIENKKKIETANKILKQTSANKNISIQKLVIINNKIKVRNVVIKNLNVKIGVLNSKIEENKRVTQVLQNNLENVKKEYAALIYSVYKNKKEYNSVLYIFSSKNFNQAYKRLKYLKQYSNYRKQQAEIIINIKSQLGEKYNSYINLVNKNKNAVASKEVENLSLKKEQEERKLTLNELKKKEKELIKEINARKIIDNKLQKTIEEIVSREAKRITKSKAAEGKKNINAEDYSKLNSYDKIVSNKFKDNKGKLPWPCDRGVVVSAFGQHEHPVLKGVIIRNYGIDLSVPKGSIIRSIFGGEISKVVAIPGANYTVIIRHGSYLSVYQNLVDVKVHAGDNVNIRQNLGYAYFDTENNSSVVHIEIWEEFNRLDPARWLSRH